MIQNPILPGFHPDPSILRVGEDYYIATSTFEWFPGVTLHHSRDLKHWEPMGGILREEQMLNLTGVPNGGGVWAPDISYDGTWFYLVFSNVCTTADGLEKDIHNYVTRSKRIDGGFEKPVYLNAGGFDESLFHDADGRKWLVGMGWDSRGEDLEGAHPLFEGIYIQEYDPEAGKLIGKKQVIFKGTELGFTEGPHLYRIGEYYYLLVAEGGTRDGHAITVARAKQITGPYETDPDYPMLTSADAKTHPIQYAGHGDLVQTPEGEWYLVHLGTRPGLFRGYSVLGRETFLEKITWNELGFPVIDGEKRRAASLVPEPKGANASCEREAAGTPQRYPFFGTYTFSEQELADYFSTLRRPMTSDWIHRGKMGTLVMQGGDSILSHFRQSMLGLRMCAPSFSCRVTVGFEPENYKQAAGLACFYNTVNFYYACITTNSAGERILSLIRRENRKREELARIMLTEPAKDLTLRVSVDGDALQYAYQTNKMTAFQPLGAVLPTHILSDEYATKCCEEGYTGAFLALCVQDQNGTKKEAVFSELCVEELAQE